MYLHIAASRDVAACEINAPSIFASDASNAGIREADIDSAASPAGAEIGIVIVVDRSRRGLPWIAQLDAPSAS